MEIWVTLCIAAATALGLIGFIFVFCKWVLFGSPYRVAYARAQSATRPTRPLDPQAPLDPLQSSVVIIAQPQGQIAVARADEKRWIVVVQPAEQEN